MDSIDVAISFDTTGSMYPCLTQVRRVQIALVKRLFKDVPSLRVAIIAHGDYCDRGRPYVTKILDFSSNQEKICKFIENVEQTGGGDAPECYELVLRESRNLSWKSGRSKALIMIGDDVPHGPSYALNTQKIDWRNELGLLLEMNINVYSVHAMPGIRSHSRSFYEEIAKKTGGFYLTLDQFSTITDLLLAVCYKQVGPDELSNFEKEIQSSGRMNRNARRILDTLLGKTSSSKSTNSDLNSVPTGRFQVMPIDSSCGIADFVRSQGVTFKKGRGFYELTKPEEIQGFKEIILMDRSSGDLFNGTKVREILELPPQSERKGSDREDVKIKPVSLEKYKIFIQSTSANRKLISDTSFLYEVDDWERAAD